MFDIFTVFELMPLMVIVGSETLTLPGSAPTLPLATLPEVQVRTIDAMFLPALMVREFFGYIRRLLPLSKYLGVF